MTELPDQIKKDSHNSTKSPSSDGLGKKRPPCVWHGTINRVDKLATKGLRSSLVHAPVLGFGCARAPASACFVSVPPWRFLARNHEAANARSIRLA